MTVLLSLLLICCTIQSQDLEVRSLAIENGLSNNTVTTIFQDHHGFIWVGTYDGLNRYDGYEFKVFRNVIGDSTTIPSNNINSISEDARNNIWIGGQKDVSIYNPMSGHFSIPAYTFSNGTVKSTLADNVVNIQRIKNNTMLIGTQQNGLFYFDNTSNNGKQVTILSGNKQIADYYVSTIKYDAAADIIYVFVQNQGLFIYNPAQHVLTLKNSGLQQVNCIAVSSNDTLLLGSNTGLYKYNSINNTLSSSVVPYKGPVVNLCQDAKGVLWIATDGAGIWLLSPGEMEASALSGKSAKKRLPINSNAVYAIYEDREQRKWIGTLRGGVNIVKAQENKFKTTVYQSAENTSAANNFILSFCEDEVHNLWIGTDGAGLRYWNRVTNSFTNFTHDANNSNSVSSGFITGIVKDNNNGIWISTWLGGINHYNPATQSFKHYRCYNRVNGAPNNNVWTLLQDSKNRLWASAVRNGGLYLYNNVSDSFELFENRMTDLQSLAEDAAGNLWGGDYTSLIKIDPVNKKHQYFNVGYTVRSIYEDRKKNFWIGTQEGGLVLFNRQTGAIKRFTTSDGLPHNTVLRILEDKQGNLWLSTYNGLTKFNPATNSFRNFNQSNGLQSSQFSFNGALALSSGELVFGGIKGFNIFYPESITGENKIPQLFLSNLNVNNAPVQNNPAYITAQDADAIRKVTIPFDEAALSFSYLGLDFSNAANINYAYFLEGWDNNWNYVKDIRTANYSRLREGTYIFKVKLSYSDGVWSEPQQLLYITVLPPWYRSWWAYSLYFLLGVAGIYLYVVYKNRQATLRYEIQVAHLETQQEKDLNEKKIAFFTNISHEFRTPLSLIINPIKDMLSKTDARTENAELKVVYRNAQRLLRLVDQLLLFKKADAETDKLNINKLNFTSLCQDVFYCFSEQARVRKIKYELQYEGKKLLLNADREKLEIALFNILSNAFKYTPDGGEIILSITELNRQIGVSISDTGPGIAEADGRKLFERFYQAKTAGSKPGFGIGLYLVKKFVEAHGGTVTYKSEAGKGTIFTILLDKHIAENIPADDNGIAMTNNPGTADWDELPEFAEQELPLTETHHPIAASSILSEMNEDITEEDAVVSTLNMPQDLTSDKETLLIIDDDNEIRGYLTSIFSPQYKIYEADSAEGGIRLAHKQLPDLIISDIIMKGLNGLDLCRTLKTDETVSHIPIILLTGTSSEETQLKSIELGADDYIKKPFDKDLLMARVKSLLKRRNILQNYFFNEVTLGTAKFKVSAEYKEFLDKCMKIIEDHLEDEQFSIKVLANEMGMSHSNLYRKVKSVSGQTIAGFIRFIRLKKAAEILIHTEKNVNETAGMVGFSDIKYFRVHFSKLFGQNPSDYIKKFRKPFSSTHTVDTNLRK